MFYTVPYIWAYITDDGVRTAANPAQTNKSLMRDNWWPVALHSNMVQEDASHMHDNNTLGGIIAHAIKTILSFRRRGGIGVDLYVWI